MKSRQRKRRAAGFHLNGGFSLMELMVVISVVVTLTVMAVPSLAELIKNNRVSSQNNELVAMLSLAKSVAIRSNQTVPVLLSAGEAGWSGQVEDPTSENDVVGCDIGVLRCADNTRVVLESGDVTLLFNSRGYLREADEPWVAETIFLEHDDCTGNRQRRRIDIMPTGQINSCDLPCGSTAVCPL